MKTINLKSFAKVNLSIDIKGVQDNGYHIVEMVMQEIGLYDKVSITWDAKKSNDKHIELTTNKFFLPTDESNIAYRAAQLMIDRYGGEVSGGNIIIDIQKVVPVAAGLAGGSGNGAIVLHGLNALWELDLSLNELCELGAELGSDVPFQVRCQGKCNGNLPAKIKNDDMALTCALATGTGTKLQKVEPLEGYMVLVKPAFSVSTKEVYDNIDECQIERRPNNEKLIDALARKDYENAFQNMANVLEAYSLKAYPEIQKAKDVLKQETNPRFVMMSGSGPTVYGIYETQEEAKAGCQRMRDLNFEAYYAKSF